MEDAGPRVKLVRRRLKLLRGDSRETHPLLTRSQKPESLVNIGTPSPGLENGPPLSNPYRLHSLPSAGGMSVTRRTPAAAGCFSDPAVDSAEPWGAPACGRGRGADDTPLLHRHPPGLSSQPSHRFRQCADGTAPVTGRALRPHQKGSWPPWFLSSSRMISRSLRNSCLSASRAPMGTRLR